MLTLSMLHFELYSGTGSGPLTDTSNKPHMRRGDLIDPTSLLKSLMADMPKGTPRESGVGIGGGVLV